MDEIKKVLIHDKEYNVSLKRFDEDIDVETGSCITVSTYAS